MKYLIALALLLLAVVVQSQDLKIELSEPLKEEPVEGFAKILQLDNQVTTLLHLTYKDGFNVKTYDAQRKLIVDQVVEPILEKKGKLNRRTAQVKGAYIISNQIVLFLQLNVITPQLYRIIIDPMTGKLVEEKLLYDLGKKNLRLVGTKIHPGEFYVKKDPLSDHYATFFENTEKEPDEQRQVQHYDGQHELINTAYLVKDDRYKDMSFIDMVVLGGDKVHSA